MPLSAAGQEIVVSPKFIEVELIGGDTVTENITVKWTGSGTIQCFISTNITSDCPGNDSEGINVTYSENSPFNLPSKVNYIVEMTIKAAINIMPGVYTITTTFSCTAEEPQPPSPPSPGRPYRPPVNIPPTANTSAGEPYQGYTGKEITFNGTKSFDPDGRITGWLWDFGDGTNGTGEIATHNYSSPGTYNVTLTVTDDDGDTDTYETKVMVGQSNRSPVPPIMAGAVLGNETVEYAYTVVSTDLDNDTIRYIFDWGDGTNTTSDFLASNITYTAMHNWTTSGVYIVTVYAEDINGDVSNVSEMMVCIAAPHSPLDEEDMTLWYALLALIGAVAISVIVFVYFMHRVRKQQKK